MLFLLLLLLLLCHIQTVYTIQSKIQSIETDLLIQACCCCFSVVVTIAATVVATIAVVVHVTTIPRYQFYLLLSRIHLAFFWAPKMKIGNLVRFKPIKSRKTRQSVHYTTILIMLHGMKIYTQTHSVHKTQKLQSYPMHK